VTCMRIVNGGQDLFDLSVKMCIHSTSQNSTVISEMFKNERKLKTPFKKDRNYCI